MIFPWALNCEKGNYFGIQKSGGLKCVGAYFPQNSVNYLTLLFFFEYQIFSFI